MSFPGWLQFENADKPIFSIWDRIINSSIDLMENAFFSIDLSLESKDFSTFLNLFQFEVYQIKEKYDCTWTIPESTILS